MGRTSRTCFAASVCMGAIIAGVWILSYRFVPRVEACLVPGRIHRLAIYRGRAVLVDFEESPVNVVHHGNLYKAVPQPLTQRGIRAAIDVTADWDEAQSGGWRFGEDVRHFAGVRVFSSGRYWETMVSLAWILVPFLILPIRLAFRRWRRVEKLECRYCRYSLTGNTSGACPECGSQIPKPPGDLHDFNNALRQSSSQERP